MNPATDAPSFSGKFCHLVDKSTRCRYGVWINHKGGPEETNEHADRFNQRSPSGQLPLLAHWSWPELSSQTHHSMSKLPSNMSPCHSTCHTARRGWSREKQAPWQGHLVGTADRTHYRATCSAHIWRTLGSLSMSANRLGDRLTDMSLLCLWHPLPLEEI